MFTCLGPASGVGVEKPQYHGALAVRSRDGTPLHDDSVTPCGTWEPQSHDVGVKSRGRLAAAGVAAVALLASVVACSGNGSEPITNTTASAGSTPSPAPRPLPSDAPASPWFVGHWGRHGTALDIAGGGAVTTASYVADMRFRIYRFCHKGAAPPCDPKVDRNTFDVGGLIRFTLDANGVGSVIFSNDSTGHPVKVRDALVVHQGRHKGTLLIQDVTRPLADFAGLVFCRSDTTARACGQ